LFLPFAISGFIAGRLQAKAIYATPSHHCAAEFWSSVRALLVQSVPGEASVALLWLNGLAILGLVVFGGHLATLPVVLGTYAAFGAARELAALGSVRMLAKVPGEKSA